ncbi:MAG: hypothetical protein QOI59_2229 [Gammaproteobacteria bacterium]|jgi:hypothetical protein|nr:hypothetical protein [Gammaproteobacteria bacterium]
MSGRPLATPPFVNPLGSLIPSGFATANRFDPGDRQHFAEIVEAELIGLHEGNFARYRIRPSEFAAWRQVWDAR